MSNDRMRLIISFKNNELEKELYEYASRKEEIGGYSAYIKKLILEDMRKNKPAEK